MDKGRVNVEPITSKAATDCIAFLEKWCEERDCGRDPEQNLDLACEKEAVINALNHIDILGGNGLLLRIDDEISAFGIAAHLTESTGALHFEKAFAHIKGLYQYFDNACAKRLFTKYRYINKESDMGIPGLAKAKKIVSSGRNDEILQAEAPLKNQLFAFSVIPVDPESSSGGIQLIRQVLDSGSSPE